MRYFVLVLLILIPLLGGCAAYKTTGERTAGEFVDDVAIHTVIKRRLITDPDIDGLGVDVTVERGVVRLSGQVASEELRAKAVRLSGTVRGVLRVEDLLTLVTE